MESSYEFIIILFFTVHSTKCWSVLSSLTKCSPSDPRLWRILPGACEDIYTVQRHRLQWQVQVRWSTAGSRMWRQSGPSVRCQWQGGTQDVQRSHKVSVSHLCLVTLSLPFLGAADISQYFHLFFSKVSAQVMWEPEIYGWSKPVGVETASIVVLVCSGCMMIPWVIHRLNLWWAQDSDNLKKTSATLFMVFLYACFACLSLFFSSCFSPQSRSCNRLHLKPLPRSHSVRRLHLSTLGHPECHWTQHFPRTHRLHSLWRPQQAQHRSLYYGWAETFFF